MKNIGIYIHVPFCHKKCPYCNFYSIKPNSLLVENYVSKMCAVIKRFGKKFNYIADTIYFGGGTPSTIGTKNIIKILKTVQNYFSKKQIETTIEVNPTDYKILDFELLRNCGVNRLSVGAQSLNDGELRILGRNHTQNDVIKLVNHVQNLGFSNISLDLISSIPGQNEHKIKNSIDFCVQNNIKHVSSYILKLEEDTPYFNMQTKINFKSDDEMAELYKYFCHEMKIFGYNHYEISNFCKKDFESKHNLKYWNCDEYLGFGPAAHSFFGKNRLKYKRDIKNFINSENNIVNLGSGGDVSEYIMLKLRLSDGINNNELKKRFNFNIPKTIFEKARGFEKLGLVNCDENSIKFTENGFLLSNQVIFSIINDIEELEKT